MSKDDIFKKLSDAIITGNQTLVKKAAKESLEAGIDPLEAVENGLSAGMRVIGDRFEKGEVFLPELLIAADTFNAAMEIFKPAIEEQKKELEASGRVLLATVKGDVHSIGKNIVATVLETNGFDVIDIGVDQQSLNIIEEAKKNKADVIALSALMTTSMPGQKEVIDILNELGLRDKFKVVVGGGPVTADWAEQIGADGYGDTAFQAVKLINSLING